MSKTKGELWLIIISFFLIYIVWGSTYLANAWGIQEVPPFIFAGARFVGAGVLLFIVARFFRPIEFTKRQVLNTLFAGFLLFAVGNGLVVWSLKYIDSGLSALIVAFEPLLVVLLLWRLKGVNPDGYGWLGLILGMAGMVLLVGQPDFATSADWVKGALAILVAILAWAWVSVWIPSADLPKSIIQSASMQMFFGGILLLLIGAVNGDFHRIEFLELSNRTIYSFIYLLIFGSMLAFSAFNYLLKTVSPMQVATCTFVNPVVAVILGVWLNQEHFSLQSIFAGGMMLTGVVFINGHAKAIRNFLKKPMRNSN